MLGSWERSPVDLGRRGGREQRTWRTPVLGPGSGRSALAPDPSSPPGQKGGWVRGAGPRRGSHLAVDQKCWPLGLAGLRPALLAEDRGLCPGRLPLRPARAPLHTCLDGCPEAQLLCDRRSALRHTSTCCRARYQHPEGRRLTAGPLGPPVPITGPSPWRGPSSWEWLPPAFFGASS